MKKKLTLSLLSLVAIGAPVATVISCGQETSINLSKKIKHVNDVSHDGRELPDSYATAVNVPTPYMQIEDIPLPDPMADPSLSKDLQNKYKIEISLLIDTYDNLMNNLKGVEEMSPLLVHRTIINAISLYAIWAKTNQNSFDDKEALKKIISQMYKVSRTLNQDNLDNFVKAGILIDEFKVEIQKLGSTELRTTVLNELEAEYFALYAWNSGSENIITDAEVTQLEDLVIKLRNRVFKYSGEYAERENIIHEIHLAINEIHSKEMLSDEFKELVKGTDKLIDRASALKIGSKESIKELNEILTMLKDVINNLVQ